jgi:MoxR-like ATPase
VFTGLFLADEINRTSPKTQSALLEAMAEGQVTVEGQSFKLPSPFHVIATSNPIEYEGTYALPEAQLDRFMVRLAVGYPTREGEQRVLLNRVDRRAEVAHVEAVITADELKAMQRGIEAVDVDEDIALYCVDLVGATREHGSVQVGASPRGAQGLMLVGRALAAMSGRDFVTPEDIKRIAVPVLAHRLSLTPQAWANGTNPADIILELADEVAGPPAVGAERTAGSGSDSGERE